MANSPHAKPDGETERRLDVACQRAEQALNVFARASERGQAARLAGPARQAAHALRQAADAGMGWQGTPSDARCAPAAIRAGPPAMTIVERRNWEQAIDRFDAVARGRDITAVIAGFEQLAALLDQAGAPDHPGPAGRSSTIGHQSPALRRAVRRSQALTGAPRTLSVVVKTRPGVHSAYALSQHRTRIVSIT